VRVKILSLPPPLHPLPQGEGRSIGVALIPVHRGGEIKKAIPVNSLEGIVQEVVIIDHTEGEVVEGFFGDWLHFCQGDHVVVSSMIDPDGN